MASAVFHDIVIQNANAMGDVTRQEALSAAGSAITPGQLIEWAAATTVQEQSVAAAGLTPKMVALTTLTPDDEDNPSIDVDYAVGDRVYFCVPKPGDRMYMWLADGETAAANALLQGDGNGDLAVLAAIVAGTLDNSVVGRTVVAIDNALGGAPARIIVEII